MTIKTYKYSLLIFLLLFSGCTKFDYTEDENSRQHINSYLTLEQAVTGAYAKFAAIFADELWRNSYLLQGMLADDYDLYSGWSCSGEDCVPYIYEGYGFQTFDDNGDTVYLAEGCYRRYHEGEEVMVGQSYLEFMNDAYRDLYKAITSQNFILCQFEDRAISNDAFNELLGEVYYMRAYSYFRLARLFGQIPLIIDADVDYQVHRASFEEIYRQIESDVLQAIRLLPVTTFTARIPYITPCRGSAKAMLAEVYLTMGGYPVHDEEKYALAAHYASEVIDSAAIYGFGLLEDYANLTDWKYGLHKEMVSIVQYKSDFNWDMVTSEYFPAFQTNELSLFYRDAITEVKFYNDYPASYRKNCTYNRAHDINITWDSTILVYPVETTSCYRILLMNSTKFDYEAFLDNTEEYYIYILRYSHTLLTYAEASARSGNLDEMSYEAINMIRRRANKQPVTSPSPYDLTEDLTPEQFIDSVVWERAWELTGEPESRWFDLLRLGMIDNLDELRDPHEAPPPYEGILIGEYFFPIPNEDVYLNPNLLTE